MSSKSKNIPDRRNAAMAQIRDLLSRLEKEDPLEPPESSWQGLEAFMDENGVNPCVCPRNEHQIKHELAWGEIARFAREVRDLYAAPEEYPDCCELHKVRKNQEKGRRWIKENMVESLTTMDCHRRDIWDFFDESSEEEPQSEGSDPVVEPLPHPFKDEDSAPFDPPPSSEPIQGRHSPLEETTDTIKVPPMPKNTDKVHINLREIEVNQQGLVLDFPEVPEVAKRLIHYWQGIADAAQAEINRLAETYPEKWAFKKPLPGELPF